MAWGSGRFWGVGLGGMVSGGLCMVSALRFIWLCTIEAGFPGSPMHASNP